MRVGFSRDWIVSLQDEIGPTYKFGPLIISNFPRGAFDKAVLKENIHYAVIKETFSAFAGLSHIPYASAPGDYNGMALPRTDGPIGTIDAPIDIVRDYFDAGIGIPRPDFTDTYLRLTGDNDEFGGGFKGTRYVHKGTIGIDLTQSGDVVRIKPSDGGVFSRSFNGLDTLDLDNSATGRTLDGAMVELDGDHTANLSNKDYCYYDGVGTFVLSATYDAVNNVTIVKLANDEGTNGANINFYWGHSSPYTYSLYKTDVENGAFPRDVQFAPFLYELQPLGANNISYFGHNFLPEVFDLRDDNRRFEFEEDSQVRYYVVGEENELASALAQIDSLAVDTTIANYPLDLDTLGTGHTIGQLSPLTDPDGYANVIGIIYSADISTDLGMDIRRQMSEDWVNYLKANPQYLDTQYDVQFRENTYIYEDSDMFSFAAVPSSMTSPRPFGRSSVSSYLTSGVGVPEVSRHVYLDAL